MYFDIKFLTPIEESQKQKIETYHRQIDDMESRLKLFLSEPQKYPNPFPEALVKEIRSFARPIAEIPKGKLTDIADSLLSKLLIYEIGWKRQLEEFHNPSEYKNI